MLELRDLPSIAQLNDPALRALIQKRVDALAEFDEYELHELVTFFVVEPGDSLIALRRHLGFAVLTSPCDFCEEHPGYFELVFIVSDDGFGLDVFIPKDPRIPPRLLALCEAHAVRQGSQS